MEGLSGFVKLQKIFESRTFSVSKAIRQEDNLPIILKLFQGPAYTGGRFFIGGTEGSRTGIPQISGVARVLEVQRVDQGFVLVTESPKGAFLKSLIDPGTLKLESILTIAIRAIGILGKIHAAQMIHTAITPFNVVYDEIRDELKILPTITTYFPQDHWLSTDAGHLPEGPLEYVSPEQTGRMNVEPDYRSDYYSFGIVLYEMLTGTVPFEADYSLGTLYGHLARPPVPPSRLNADIPEMVSRLVTKLLSKDRDNRYQSSEGIRRDLLKCSEDLRTTGGISPFQIAQADVPERYRFPDKLYGRRPELEQLQNAYDRVRSGRHELVTILGLPAAVRRHWHWRAENTLRKLEVGLSPASFVGTEKAFLTMRSYRLFGLLFKGSSPRTGTRLAGGRTNCLPRWAITAR